MQYSSVSFTSTDGVTWTTSGVINPNTYFNSITYGPDFADNNDIPVWAIGSVAYIKQADIVHGKGDNKFAPQDHATRAEAVTVLLNMLEQMSK